MTAKPELELKSRALSGSTIQAEPQHGRPRLQWNGPIMFRQLKGLCGFWSSMAGMVRILVILAVALGGGSLGALGLYMGRRLSRHRSHRKSEEIQALFSKANLD
jgi:hypothetical protein